MTDFVKRQISNEVKEQVEIEVKYKGYIDRQQIQIEKFKKMEDYKILMELITPKFPNSEKKLVRNSPKSGPISFCSQASCISGFPADIAILMIYLAGKLVKNGVFKHNKFLKTYIGISSYFQSYFCKFMVDMCYIIQ